MKMISSQYKMKQRDFKVAKFLEEVVNAVCPKETLTPEAMMLMKSCDKFKILRAYRPDRAEVGPHLRLKGSL